MHPSKKPKYKLDPKKFEEGHEHKEKKEKDWTEEELYSEILREKSRHRYR